MEVVQFAIHHPATAVEQSVDNIDIAVCFPCDTVILNLLPAAKRPIFRYKLLHVPVTNIHLVLHRIRFKGVAQAKHNHQGPS